SRMGHKLLIGPQRSWTPEDGLSGAAGGWGYLAGVSPDGTQVAYTAYAGASNIRAYTFALGAAAPQPVIDAPRSEVTFVKDGWVWFWGETLCGDCPGGSAATGPVYAMQLGATQLATGKETPVVFAAGESPVALQSYWGPGQFWPNS
ncbi:MAG TPA: hypothetical protein VJS19_10955, partial [Candidatus Dormibacteraeota bacterium]|nr:hypothetical protein [Candidatus Dormibacteraeota bacterium]